MSITPAFSSPAFTKMFLPEVGNNLKTGYELV